jgi:hypothetical protein
MSSNLPVLSTLNELTNTRITRQASREIAKARAYGATISAMESAKVEAIAQVTETALMATSHVSAVEALLIERTPHAESRLRHIADAGCTGMANVVLGTGRRV